MRIRGTQAVSCSSWPPLILKIQLDRYAHSATVCAILYFLTLRRFYMRPNVYRWKRRRCHAVPWPPLSFKGHALSLRQTYKVCDVAHSFHYEHHSKQDNTRVYAGRCCLGPALPALGSDNNDLYNDTNMIIVQHDSQRSGTDCLSQIVANTDPSTT